MESYEYIVRYYTIDAEGVYRRNTVVTSVPSCYIKKHEHERYFVLISIEPIDRTYRRAIAPEAKYWSDTDA